MRKNRPLLITIIAVFVLVVLMVITGGAREASTPESVTGSIFTPVQRFFYDITGSIADFFNNLFGGGEDVDAAELERTIAQLETELMRLDELEQENKRLRELLEYKDQYNDLLFVTAHISSKEPGPWFEVFTINVGRNYGVKENMPVVCSKGVVGRVIEAGGTWAKVMTIIDTRSSISCLLDRARIYGITKGKLQSDDAAPVCTLMYLPYETDLVPGDNIVTSGLSGDFPKGLLIGSVIEVTKNSEKGQKTALIKPAVDFATLEEVMVVIGEKEDEGS
ncbi:MAG: rod shape-determining protein MreC [Christensenellales bacterium]